MRYYKYMVEERTHSSSFTLVIIVLIALVGWIAWNYFGGKVAPQTPPVVIHDRSYDQNMVVTRAQFVVPTVTTQKEISQKDLPTSLSKFILSSATSTSIKSATYSDGKKGFLIIYKIFNTTIENLNATLVSVAQTNKWSLISGQRADLANILSYEDKNYKLTILSSTEKAGDPIDSILFIIKK
jgi:hypothetical protein